MKNVKRKTIIIGAGLGGLVHGIMLKKANSNDEVIIYDLNNKPGGFCTSFKKIAKFQILPIIFKVKHNRPSGFTLHTPQGVFHGFNFDFPLVLVRFFKDCSRFSQGLVIPQTYNGLGFYPG